jgi:hypothetical protein
MMTGSRKTTPPGQIKLVSFAYTTARSVQDVCRISFSVVTGHCIGPVATAPR